jgi:hypothetical protein
MTVTYSNILEIIADQDDARAERRVEEEQDSSWSWNRLAPPLATPEHLAAHLKRLDEDFAPAVERMKCTEAVLSSPINGGR